MPATIHRAPDAGAMAALGAAMASDCRPGDVVLLVGPLGAGKTTFTQGLARGLAVRGPVTSPTFVIAREHESESDGLRLLHVDAYRLGGLDELDDLDLDWASSETVTVVEWGGELADHLDVPVVTVTIDRDTDAGEGRTVTVDWPEGRP